MSEIATTLRSVVKPGMTPKELRAAVRERYPEATKRDIIRGAFYALTDTLASGDEALADLHHFALTERGDEEQDGPLPKKLRKKHRRKEREAQTAAN